MTWSLRRRLAVTVVTTVAVGFAGDRHRALCRRPRCRVAAARSGARLAGAHARGDRGARGRSLRDGAAADRQRRAAGVHRGVDARRSGAAALAEPARRRPAAAGERPLAFQDITLPDERTAAPSRSLRRPHEPSQVAAASCCSSLPRAPNPRCRGRTGAHVFLGVGRGRAARGRRLTTWLLARGTRPSQARRRARAD